MRSSFHQWFPGRLFSTAAGMLLGAAICLATASTGLAQSPARPDLPEVVDAIIRQTNEFRQSKDLPPLESEASLTQAAERFAQFMAETDQYGHRADDRTPAQRAEAAGYDYCVVRENIAYRTNTGEVSVDSLTEVFVQGWIDSPPHRKNMLADYSTHTGVAVASEDGTTFYAVQLFGRPKSAAFRVKLMNQTGQTQTVRFRADDQQDEVELRPRMILTLSRCFPTEISIVDREASVRVNQSATYHVTDQGLEQAESEATESSPVKQ
ncbi:CAP domain-containing protein [Roseimaritima sediminicola]|uniref:CAP domain-containing protein n=1 Tax=Roseimaritima sediminicola TaxID=2662066 RepID=UPI00138706C9|nr:CAP domain-containing protein [Roseimaritima sediminicola]